MQDDVGERLSGSSAGAISFADVTAAADAISGSVVSTPCDQSLTLSHELGTEIWLKFENLQFTASYKERGALNKLLHLTEVERARGVIAMSAGNHAQAVAYHGGRLGIPVMLVMPEGTPAVKVENTRRWGAEVVLAGDSLEAAAQYTYRRAEERELVLLHPFNDPLVAAGQGTVGLEVLKAVPDLDVLVVPVGGGGLLSGMAVAAKGIKADIEIIGAQTTYYPGLFNRFKGTSLAVGGDTIAEGIAVAEPGSVGLPILDNMVDDVVIVSERDVETALAMLLMIEKTLVEGAGAIGLGAVLANRARFAGRRVGLVLTGGNIDAALLARVLTRELAREGRLSRLTVEIPDRPGALGQVAAVVGTAQANIIELYHQRVFTSLPARGTQLNLVIETRDQVHLESVLEALRTAGYRALLKSTVAK